MSTVTGAQPRWFALDAQSNLGAQSNQKTTKSDAVSAEDEGGSLEKAMNGLGEDAFLRLLSTQLRYQNPLEPVKDQAFVAQLAQFSALEQMQSLNKSFEAFAQAQTHGGDLGDAIALIGKTVSVSLGDNGEISGEVSGIQLVDGVPKLVIGQSMYDLDAVTAVVPAA